MAKSKQHRRRHGDADDNFNLTDSKPSKQLELFPEMNVVVHYDEEEEVKQEWPGLDAINKEWV